MNRRRLPMIATALLLSAAPMARGDLAPPRPRAEDGQVYECGVVALFLLLNLDGRPTDLDDLASRLSARQGAGHSMEDLRVAARASGLNLVGVRFGKDSGRLDGPALCYFDRSPHGHFAVVKPVGHTGTLVQILDPPRPPEVIDFSTLRSSPGWTGLALVERKSAWIPWIAGATGLGLVAFFSTRLANQLFGGPASHGRRAVAGSSSESV